MIVQTLLTVSLMAINYFKIKNKNKIYSSLSKKSSLFNFFTLPFNYNGKLFIKKKLQKKNTPIKNIRFNFFFKNKEKKQTFNFNFFKIIYFLQKLIKYTTNLKCYKKKLAYKKSQHLKYNILNTLAAFVNICLISLLFNLVSAKSKRCVMCNVQAFEELKQFRQEQILSDLLKKLELSAKPNVTVNYDTLPLIERSNLQVKELLRKDIIKNHKRVRKNTERDFTNNDIFEENFDFEIKNEEEYFNLNSYKTTSIALKEINYIIGKQAPDWFSQTEQVAYFELPKKLKKKYIKKATLNVFLRPLYDSCALQSLIQIEVYERFYNGSLGDKIAAKHEQIKINFDSDIHVKVNLDSMDFKNWFSAINAKYNDSIYYNKDSYVGLYVQALCDDENIVLYPNNVMNKNENMFIELEIYDKNERRLRRDTMPTVCRLDSNETKCCLYDLMIDFEKVGWDFVIAPKRYNAFICNGECSFTQVGQTARGLVAQRAHLNYLQCCHPKEYSGITIVYVTESNQIWVKEVPGMIARRCGCA